MYRHKFFFFLTLLASVLLISCRNTERKAIPEYRFTDSLLLRHTPVRSQGAWPVGWIYATLGMVESDRIRVSDSLELSATYLIRRSAERALAFRAGGKGRMNAAGAFEGTPYACLDLMKQTGIVTYAGYHRRSATDCVRFWKNLTEGDAQTVLDTTFGYLPPYVSLYGALYTPVDLARSLFLDEAYEAFTAIPTLPRGTYRMALKGDVRKERYTNVRPEDFPQIADTTLRHGYTLVWMGDTTCAGYVSARGIAICPTISLTPTLSGREGDITPRPTGERLTIEGSRKRAALSLQERGSEKDFRSRLYRSGGAPYHCLQIIGIAYGKARGLGRIFRQKKRFFVCRGSQGAQGSYRGLIYLSEDYLKTATAALYRHKIKRRSFE